MGGIWVSPGSVSGTTDINGITSTLVEARFADAASFAINARDWTYQYSNAVVELVGDLELPATGEIGVDIPDIPPINYSSRPKLPPPGIDEQWPTAPEEPTITTVNPPAAIEIPVFSIAPPQIGGIEKPVFDDIKDPGDAPTIGDTPLPPLPDLTPPDKPFFTQITVPSAPRLDIPVFDATYVDEAIDIPAGFSWAESPYNSPVWVNLLETVLDGLRNGGTGLSPETQADIFANGIALFDREADKALQEIESYFAAKNHLLPQGALAEKVTEIMSANIRSKRELLRDITTEQAKLAKEHTQYIIDKAVSVETVLREFHNSQNGRTLEAAKELAASAVTIYNAMVSRMQLKIEKYKADASVYESRIRAVQMIVEVFKAQVEAAKLEADIQETLASIYKEQIAALEVMARMYSVQLESAKLSIEKDRLKLDAFKTSTEIYVARLSAQQVKADIYGKELEADKTKAEIFTEQVRGFAAHLEAKKAESNIAIAGVDIRIRGNDNAIEKYKAQLDAYKAAILAVSSKVSGRVDGFKAEVAGYSAETEALASYYGAIIKEIETRIRKAELQTTQAVAKVEATTRGYVAVKELQLKGTQGLVTVGAQLASAAMTSVNANASIGASASNSNSDSFSSHESLNESHGYQHEG
jgi:hypothetical protein